MNIILIMIPLALLILVAAALIFFWAVNHGQFDDMDSPSFLPVSDHLDNEHELRHASPSDDNTP